METQSHIEVVRAPIDTCFEALVDFERYPDVFSGIAKASVADADPAAGTWTVNYELNIVIKTIRYTLAYTSDRPHKLDWKLVEGDVTDVVGSYALRELEPGVTEAECTQSIDVGFWIPGPIRRGFEKSALVDSVREFKAAAEKRAG